MPSIAQSRRTPAWQRLLKPAKRLRRPRTGEHTMLTTRRIYILPTRYGLLYAGCLLLILIGAINYQNNLGYMLAFLLGSLGMVAMIHTWRNLLQLSLQGGRAEPVFAGQEACFPVFIQERSGRERLAVRVAARATSGSVGDLPADQTTRLTVHACAERRGRFDPGPVTISTIYPLGLFRAWSHMDLGLGCLVYPAPAASGEPPQEEVPGGRESGNRGEGVDDFIGLRPYREGDSLKHIFWKALARERGLVSKQFGGSFSQQMSLNWDLLPEVDLETRLSLLCRFVLIAHEQGQRYGLKLPGRIIAEGSGPEHRQLCLSALAEFGLPEH